MTSLYLCFDENCVDDGEKEKWIEVKSLWCDENAGVTLPVLSEVLERWNEDRRTTVRRLSADEILQWPTLKEVVLPSHEFYQRAFTTMVSRVHLIDSSNTKSVEGYLHSPI